MACPRLSYLQDRLSQLVVQAQNQLPRCPKFGKISVANLSFKLLLSYEVYRSPGKNDMKITKVTATSSSSPRVRIRLDAGYWGDKVEEQHIQGRCTRATKFVQ